MRSRPVVNTSEVSPVQTAMATSMSRSGASGGNARATRRMSWASVSGASVVGAANQESSVPA